MVNMSFIPKPRNNYFKDKSYDAIIIRNAKFKGFCKYFSISELKEKRCLKYKNLCSDNENCKKRRNTLENVLR